MRYDGRVSFTNVKFKIWKASDRELVRNVAKFISESPVAAQRAQINYIGGGPSTVIKPTKKPLDPNEFAAEVGNSIIHSISIAFERAELAINRLDSPTYDDVAVTLTTLNAVSQQRTPQGQVNQATPAAKVAPDAVRKMLALAKVLFVGADTTTPIGPPDMTEYYAKRESEIARLQAFIQDSIRALHEQSLQVQRELETQYTSRRDTLDKQAEEESRKREEAYNRRFEELQKDFAEKEAKVAEHEKAILAREKEIDDADNRIARRAIRQDLKKAIANHSKGFSLTSTTKNMRRIVHAFSILLLLAFASGSIAVGIELTSLVTSDAPLNVAVFVASALRQIFFAGAFTATAVFYLRWNNVWFQQHAEEEFRLKQLELDFDRASWVVEMALEWKDEGGADLPPELLSRLTTGLFSRPSENGQNLHPADEIASALLGSAAELEINLPNGVGRARLDRKGVRELQKPLGGK